MMASTAECGGCASLNGWIFQRHGCGGGQMNERGCEGGWWLLGLDSFSFTLAMLNQCLETGELDFAVVFLAVAVFA